MFQSTYLYKVRQRALDFDRIYIRFNPRTYIRYDVALRKNSCALVSFNPRTYIRYDILFCPSGLLIAVSFNPRTYIRYDFYESIVSY